MSINSYLVKVMKLNVKETKITIDHFITLCVQVVFLFFACIADNNWIDFCVYYINVSE